MRKVQSTCNYSALDCNLDFYEENGQIVKVVPTKGYPVNDGFCCIKGLSLDKQQQTVKPPVYHTMAVLLAPCSLCVVSYLNLAKEPNTILLYVLYFCVLASLAFILIKLPRFFAFPFAPGYAGLTFPMCIGIVATNKMSAYLAGTNEALSGALAQLGGIQTYITTMIVGYVLLNFIIMSLRIERK